MPIMKMVLGYAQNGKTDWTITNYGAFANPNLFRAAADTWNSAYMTVLGDQVTLKFCKVITDPWPPGTLHNATSFPVSSFADQTGLQVDEAVTSSLYLLGRGSGSGFGGSSYWKFHGIGLGFLSVDNTAWSLAGLTMTAFQAACLAFFSQFRPVATPAFIPGQHPPNRNRGYPICNPPASFGSFDLETDIYETKTGRVFLLPGIQRR